ELGRLRPQGVVQENRPKDGTLGVEADMRFRLMDHLACTPDAPERIRSAISHGAIRPTPATSRTKTLANSGARSKSRRQPNTSADSSLRVSVVPLSVTSPPPETGQPHPGERAICGTVEQVAACPFSPSFGLCAD